MTLIERCSRTALALLLAASLVGVVPASAGPFDEPPLPGGGQPVVAGPGAAATAIATGTGSGGGAAGAAGAVIEERLLPGDTSDTFDIGGQPMTTRALLATVEQYPILLDHLQAALDRDIAIAGLPLAIDDNTRLQLRRIDDKYVPLQAALAVGGEYGRAPIAVYEAPNGPATALQGIFADPSPEPLRYGFITRVNPTSSHWVAGDLYVDKAAGVVSLVTWDSVATFSLDMVTSTMGRVLERAAPGDQRIAFVASHNRANLQSLSTGCAQCSLSFLDEMRELDLHSGQIGELRAAVAGDAVAGDRGGLPATHELNASRSVDFLRIRVDQTAGLPDSVIALTNARTALVDTLATRVEELLAGRSNGTVDDADFAAGMDGIRDILVDVQGDRQRRILDSNQSDIVSGRLVPRPGREKLVNLRIDRLRVRDLEAIRAQLNDEPFAFLGAARDLDATVVLDGVAAGRRQQRLLAQDEPRLPDEAEAVDVDAASTADHEPARAITREQTAAALDTEALLERAETVDAPEAADQAAGRADVVVDEAHDVARSFRDEAVRRVNALFDQVQAEARGRVDRDADRPDDNDQPDREGGRERVAER